MVDTDDDAQFAIYSHIPAKSKIKGIDGKECVRFHGIYKLDKARTLYYHRAVFHRTEERLLIHEGMRELFEKIEKYNSK